MIRSSKTQKTGVAEHMLDAFATTIPNPVFSAGLRVLDKLREYGAGKSGQVAWVR